MLRMVAILVVVLAAGQATAVDIGGVQIDDRATVGGRQLVLNGGGVRKRLVFKVYVASLYLPQKADDPAAVLASAPRRIRLDLLRNLSAETFIDALNEGLAANNSATEMAAIKPGAAELASIMKAFGQVKDHDTVTLDFLDGATHVGLNGEARGVVPGEAFNRALTLIWLGDKPVQEDLKKSLLGG
ncbi:MAG TPA: chalcone isomerase family protein [Casimicrobiaceae bacterium]|nr:chalcone isomerase family protein [Casimicrobiaceae bacterium]